MGWFERIMIDCSGNRLSVWLNAPMQSPLGLLTSVRSRPFHTGVQLFNAASSQNRFNGLARVLGVSSKRPPDSKLIGRWVGMAELITNQADVKILTSGPAVWLGSKKSLNRRAKHMEEYDNKRMRIILFYFFLKSEWLTKCAHVGTRLVPISHWTITAGLICRVRCNLSQFHLPEIQLMVSQVHITLSGSNIRHYRPNQSGQGLLSRISISVWAAERNVPRVRMNRGSRRMVYDVEVDVRESDMCAELCALSLFFPVFRQLLSFLVVVPTVWGLCTDLCVTWTREQHRWLSDIGVYWQHPFVLRQL